MRLAWPAFVVVALIAAGAPVVMASTIDVQERGIGGIVYEAEKGEANRVTIVYTDRLFEVVDRGTRITRPKVCRRVRRHTQIQVRCHAPRTAAANLVVKLLDGNDRLTVKPARRRGFTTVYGGDGRDAIRVGSGAANGLYFGEGGDDLIVVGRSRGQSEIDGGDGNDRSVGGPGKDFVFDEGGYGSDTTGRNDDRLEGRAGNDKLDGGFGDDTLLGGPGNDILDSRDRDPDRDGGDIDPGSDKLDGGAGDDVLSGLDEPVSQFGGGAEVDQLTCGPGNDHAVADQLDVVAPDCEQVDRIPDEGEPAGFEAGTDGPFAGWGIQEV